MEYRTIYLIFYVKAPFVTLKKEPSKNYVSVITYIIEKYCKEKIRQIPSILIGPKNMLFLYYKLL